MTVTVQDVADRGGMTGEGNNRGPCPVCEETQTSSKDKRPPVRLKGDDQWLCVASEHGPENKGGGPVTLARHLHARGRLTDDQLADILRQCDTGAARAPEPVVKPRADGSLDVAGGWYELHRHPSKWRGRVEQWAAERGMSAEIARAIVDSGSVAAVPAGRWPQGLDGWLEAVSWPPRDLLVALRDADGAVVDLERRFIRGSGKPEHGPKTARLKTEQRGELPDAVMFGDLPRAVEAAQRGEPVILVEGSSDWAQADACCRLRRRGVALGSYGAHGLAKVAKALVKALGRAAKPETIVPGRFTVHVVPDVGDWREDPVHASHLIGERCAWNAAIDLLDVARVRWCQPVTSGKGDLSDALAGERDPVGAFWKLMRDGLPVLDSGFKIKGRPQAWYPFAEKAACERWQRATDRELRQHAYRLPLAEYVHYHHFFAAKSDKGEDIVYDASLRHRWHMDGATRLTRAVVHWLRTHGIQFSRDDEDQWVFDPLEPARAPLVCHETARELPRVFKVRSRQFWEGWLQELGYLNPTSGDGRVIERALYQLAQRSARSTLRSWLCCDGQITKPVISLHLSSRMEEVMQVDANGSRVVANGAGRRILLQSADVPQIEYIDGMSPSEASGLMARLFGSCITVAPPLRLMMVAHTLLMFVRELLSARPILYSTGMAGAGKSMLAKTQSVWLTGLPDPDKMTPAAAWEEGRHSPLLLLDNLEPRYVEGPFQEFLLTASTSQQRSRRSNQSDRGVIKQRVKALVQISAIGPPTTPEMLRRCLLVEHDMKWRRDGFSEMDHLDAVRRDRAALWTAALVLFQARILPALAAGLHRSFHVPTTHPNESMREALGIMAAIGQSLAATSGEWEPLDWRAWLELTEAAIADTRLHTDPLTLALDELLRQWNRIVVDRVDGQPRRPALADGLYACKPLFYDLLAGEVTGEAGRGALEQHVVQVVGVEGSYTELYRDLLVATGHSAAFREHVTSAKDVGHHIGHVDGWVSDCVWRHRSGRRRYRWACTRTIERVSGGQEQEPMPMGGTDA